MHSHYIISQCTYNVHLTIIVCIEYCIILLKHCRNLFMTSVFYKSVWVYRPRECSKSCPHSRLDWCLWLMDLFCEQGPIRILVSLMNKSHHRWNLCSMLCPDQRYAQDFIILGLQAWESTLKALSSMFPASEEMQDFIPTSHPFWATDKCQYLSVNSFCKYLSHK